MNAFVSSLIFSPLIGMSVGAFVVLIDFGSYELARATVTLEAGGAIFLARHFARFQKARRRDAEVVDLGHFPFSKG